MNAPASLSVVVVTPSTFAQVRRTVRHLHHQDVADAIELVLVAPSEDAVADRGQEEVAGFGAVRTVAVGPIPNVDRAAARGILAATTDVVAVVEDHGFAQPGWARAILDAYTGGPWVAVGSVMANANPDRGLSWANLMLGYGWWVDPGGAGEMHDVPSHNGSYRRKEVAAFGQTLPDRMGRLGDLHDRLRHDGGRMYLAAGATIAHANPSRVAPTADLRFHAGRLYAAERSQGQNWSNARRLLYAAASPLIPFVRLRRFVDAHLAPGRAHHHLFPRVLPALLAALAFDAAGQAAGYLRGPGRAREVLAVFEMDRLQHLTPADRRLLTETRPGGDGTPP